MDIDAVIEAMEAGFADVRLCGGCGSPDTREVDYVRGGTWHTNVMCLECGWRDNG